MTYYSHAPKHFLSLFQPAPTSPESARPASQERQGRILGALLAVALPCAIAGLLDTLVQRRAWALGLGPLVFVMLACARFNRRGHILAASRLFLTALTCASVGTEISQVPGGPTPLLFAAGAVFCSGFLVGRRVPFALAALNTVAVTINVRVLIAAHAVPVAVGAEPPLTAHPLIEAVTLTVFAFASSLLAGSLENARARADELAHFNAALADANARLEALATADPLTGLLNHRGLVAALDSELERAHRYARPCVLLFLDIDHFKSLNDGCGHAAGDAVLQEFARVVRASLRGVDILGRWGGEEFVVLLPELDSAGAETAAERVRSSIAQHVFPTAGGLRLTCSVGVASFPADAGERSGLLEAADRAMYAAKRLGRNQVRHAADPAVAALLMGGAGSGSREEAAILGTVDALASLVAARDCYTGEHSQELAALAQRLCAALEIAPAEAQAVSLAGRLHDIGKVGVPDAILHKAGRLTEDEWIIIRRHPLLGAEVVGHAPALRMLVPLIRSHHERWDGGGYPDGLSGDAIPLGARVLAVADTYLAMTSDRPYHTAREHAWALEQIGCLSGTQFDPRVVDALRRVFQPVREAQPSFAPAASFTLNGTTPQATKVN